jgi:hypothetical protein
MTRLVVRACNNVGSLRSDRAYPELAIAYLVQERHFPVSGRTISIHGASMRLLRHPILAAARTLQTALPCCASRGQSALLLGLRLAIDDALSHNRGATASASHVRWWLHYRDLTAPAVAISTLFYRFYYLIMVIIESQSIGTLQ